MARIKENEKPSSSGTATGSDNDWTVVREGGAKLNTGQAPFKAQPKQTTIHPDTEFESSTKDDTLTNNSNSVTCMPIIDNGTEATFDMTNLELREVSPLELSDKLELVNNDQFNRNTEVKQYLHESHSSGTKDGTQSNHPSVIVVKAMVHQTEATNKDANSEVNLPLANNNSRPKRHFKVKEYFNKDDFSSDSDEYDSDKDPVYAPDIEHDLKLQERRKIDQVIAQVATIRSERLQNVEEINVDAIEVMEESSDKESENIEYNIIVRNDDDDVGKKKKGKKRSLNKDNWSKIKSKKLRNSGEAYTSSSKSKKEMPKKELKPPCKDNCRIKCKTKISENERLELFKTYWSLGDLTRQRDFLATNMLEINPTYQYKKEGSNRKLNHAFYFEINGKRIRVCKEFFKNTLGINDRPIRTVISKKNTATGGVVADDLRGKHNKHQTDEDKSISDSIRRHIDSIPKVESHYLRANTSREFIEGGKSIADLHRDYADECKSLQQPSGTYKKYYEIFTKEYNISVFIPKKDQCELCHSYITSEGDEKAKLVESYERHIVEKDLSRLKKESDKEIINDKVIVACYDLQAVLPCPKGEVSLMYYKSKLNLLNLTVCELKQDSVFCFTWHEGEGGRGSCEIATCVYNYMREKVQNTTDDIEFIFYSDNCSGQQKNKYVFSMYLYAVENLPIKSITHNFLIKGHSQNEGDNVHSMIEKQIKRCLKSGPIYHPAQYITLMKTAKKKGNPYKVHELSHEDFLDFKDLWSNIGCNTTVNEKGKLHL